MSIRPMAARAGAATACVVLTGAALGVPSGATAEPAAAPPTVTGTGCERPTDQEPGSSAKVEIESGGLERTYVLRLPAGYEERSDWPLVVAYHGRGSTGTEVEGYSELSRLPAVVAYPEGAIGTGDGFRRAWQGAPYEAPGVDDVAFTEDLLDDLQSTLCVDPARTYATGKSNGGGLVALLACRLPDRFAAVAPVAAAYYPGTRAGCEAAADAPPVPVLAVHGTADETIPYDGDAERGLPAVRDQVALWAERNGCRPEPRTVRIDPDIVRLRYRGCADGAGVQHVAVTGGGHVWPGADVYSGGGHVSHTIETSRVLWRFFSRYAETDQTALTDQTAQTDTAETTS